MTVETIDFTGVEYSVMVTEALRWQARGAVPIAIKPGEKKPAYSGWERSKRRSPDELQTEMGGGQNLGLLLGEASSGLVDVDLDVPEALLAAPYLLPDTELKHCRRGFPVSHWWYHCIDGSPRPMRLKDLPDEDNPGGKALVELRSTGGQTVIPPSRYDDGGVLSWVSQGNAREIGHADIGRCVRELGAAVLLARHGFGPGGRHDAYLALAGGLANLGWTEAHALRFCLAIGATYTDHDDAHEIEYDRVRTTFEAHEQGDPHTGWPTLETIIGEDVVKRALSWLESEALEESVAAFEWRDLSGLLDSRTFEADWLMQNVLYRGAVCNFQGESGAGKTLIMLAWALEMMRTAKVPCIWVDEEMGAPQLGSRMFDLLTETERAHPERLSNLLSYSGMSGVTSQYVDWVVERAGAMAEEHGQTGLIVLDSIRNMLANEGLSENDNTEVSAWYQRLAIPLRKTGWAVVIIDHLSKAKEGRGMYAVGASAKLSISDYAWRVLTVNDSPFSKHQMGKVRLKVQKDREGAITQRELTLKLGGNSAGRTVVEFAGPVVKPAAALAPGRSDVEERIIIHLANEHPSPEMMTPTSSITAYVQGGRAAILDALNVLALDPTTGIKREKLGAQGWGYWFEAPEGDTEVEVDFS